MTKLEIAARQALKALEMIATYSEEDKQCDNGYGAAWVANTAITALREALAEQAEQEPAGRWNWNEAKFEWLTKFDYHKHHMTPLYAAPVRTKDLTVSELDAIIEKHYDDEMDLKAMILDVIAADREKNK